MSHLPTNQFHSIVALTPLVSIDLIVGNSQGEILLGKRNNRPAQGSWFVPGGRVLKNERLDDAFKRLTQEELGLAVTRDKAIFQGIHEHLYEDSVFGETPDTHYVVLVYRIEVNPEDLQLPNEQHSEYSWWTAEDIIKDSSVHENTKAYI